MSKTPDGHRCCARLLRTRLFFPDVCPCMWSMTPVDKAFRETIGWARNNDEAWSDTMYQIGNLFV